MECIVSSSVTIIKKTAHAARLSTIHVRETAARIKSNTLTVLLITEIHIKACLLETSIHLAPLNRKYMQNAIPLFLF